MSLAPSAEETASPEDTDVPMPEQDENGIYQILNGEQHGAFLAAHPNEVVVLKFYAPWCRACKGLEPKFIQIRKDEKYANLPILWAQMSVQNNKDYIKSIGVLALPSMHFYGGSEGLVENFPCGPSKIPIFKKKFAAFLNERIDPRTFQLKTMVSADWEVDCSKPGMETSKPCADRAITAVGSQTELSVGSVVVSADQWTSLRQDIPFFQDFDDVEFSELMGKAKLQTFEAGSVIMRQGAKGEHFYVIESGEVEAYINTNSADPLMAPSSYLGTVINRLSKDEYFGERSLITGQPRAATIRAVEKTRCFVFEVDDIPESSVLSGKKSATVERLAEVDDKYGVDMWDLDLTESQFRSVVSANQNRGSLNTPYQILGLDTDDDIDYDDWEQQQQQDEVVDPSVLPAPGVVGVNGNEDTVISILLRFQLIRHAARCFEYIVQTQPTWGAQGEIKRRSLLVARLTSAQREEFTEVFKLIDGIVDGEQDGKISLLELKKAMNSIGEEKTDKELQEMINKADASMDGNTEIGYTDFMGVMAEAEFYYLFMETFKMLDKENIGFVRARDLDNALCGVRDLISDDRKSIIDVDDEEMLIDYEQFAKMLLGAEVRH